MAFAKPNDPEKQKFAYEVAAKLDEIFLDTPIEVLKKAIDFMAQNTRDRLLLVIHGELDRIDMFPDPE